MADDTLTLRADLIFEYGRLLRSSARPSLAQFVESYPGISPSDLAELIMIDQSARWAQGDRALLESYIDQFPQFTCHEQELVTLLGYEYELRHLHGDAPQPQQYYERFPEVQTQL